MNPDPEENGGTSSFAQHEEPPTILDPTAPIQESKSKVYARKTAKGIWRAIKTLFRWQNLFTAVIAVAAILQYFMSEKLWKVSKESSDAAGISANAAKSAAKTAAKSLEISQRAYLSVTEEPQNVLGRGWYLNSLFGTLAIRRPVGSRERLDMKDWILKSSRSTPKATRLCLLSRSVRLR